MDARYLKLQEVCNQNADVMMPSSYVQKHESKPTNFLIETDSDIAFCNLQGVGSRSFEALFMRHRAHSAGADMKRTAFYENFAKAHKNYKKAIMVRHPMERLISVYRYALSWYKCDAFILNHQTCQVQLRLHLERQHWRDRGARDDLSGFYPTDP